MNEKRLSQFSHNARKYRLVNSVTADFITVKGKMTEMSYLVTPFRRRRVQVDHSFFYRTFLNVDDVLCSVTQLASKQTAECMF